MEREDPLQQERDYLFKRILLWEVVAFVILLFLGDKKSSKKVVGGHYRLCPPLWLRTVHRTVRLTRRARNAFKDYYLSAVGDPHALRARGLTVKNGGYSLILKYNAQHYFYLVIQSGAVRRAWNPRHGTANPIFTSS